MWKKCYAIKERQATWTTPEKVATGDTFAHKIGFVT